MTTTRRRAGETLPASRPRRRSREVRMRLPLAFASGGQRHAAIVLGVPPPSDPRRHWNHWNHWKRRHWNHFWKRFLEHWNHWNRFSKILGTLERRVRLLPPKPVADTARGSCSSWTAASREAGCSAVWLLGSASTAHAEAQGGWPASTVLRLLSSAALKRPKPRCAAILAAMRMDG